MNILNIGACGAEKKVKLMSLTRNKRRKEMEKHFVHGTLQEERGGKHNPVSSS